MKDYWSNDTIEQNLLHTYRKLSTPGKTEVNNFADYTLAKEQSAVKKSKEVYLAAAHNDDLSPEEQELMQQDIDEL